jgi:hypothetical protein
MLRPLAHGFNLRSGGPARDTTREVRRSRVPAVRLPGSQDSGGSPSARSARCGADQGIRRFELVCHRPGPLPALRACVQLPRAAAAPGSRRDRRPARASRRSDRGTLGRRRRNLRVPARLGSRSGSGRNCGATLGGTCAGTSERCRPKPRRVSEVPLSGCEGHQHATPLPVSPLPRLRGTVQVEPHAVTRFPGPRPPCA